MEAALIMPVVVCILVMIIYMACYLYDRCVLAQDSYVLSYRQSIQKGKADRVSAEEIHRQLGEKLFMLSGLDTAASSGREIRVKCSGEMEPPLFGLPVFDGERTWRLDSEKKARKTDPPRDYRRVRRILNLASGARPASGAEEP